MSSLITQTYTSVYYNHCFLYSRVDSAFKLRITFHCINLIILDSPYFTLEDKSKDFPYPCHKGVWGSRGKAPFILNLGCRWRWLVNFMPLQKTIPVPITQEALRDGLNVSEKKYPISLASTGIRNSEREACNLVIIPTMLYTLHNSVQKLFF